MALRVLGMRVRMVAVVVVMAGRLGDVVGVWAGRGVAVRGVRVGGWEMGGRRSGGGWRSGRRPEV